MTGLAGTNGDLAGRPVLVTGATGFIGTHLVQALQARGALVHALRRTERAGLRLPLEGTITWHDADLLDAGSLRRAVLVADPAIVFHLAAYGAVIEQRDRDLLYRTNVEGTWNLWRALDGRPARLVYTGTCAEYGQGSGLVSEDAPCRPESLYAASKNAASVLLSSLARETGRAAVVLRLFGPFGAADDAGRIIPRVLLALLRGQTVDVTKGEQRRDYSHVDDNIAALLLAATATLARPCPIYNVGSGRAIALRDLIELLASLVGPGALKLVRFGAVPYRPNEIWDMTCSIETTARELGYSPRVSLEEGLGRTIEWYRQRHSDRAVL